MPAFLNETDIPRFTIIGPPICNLVGPATCTSWCASTSWSRIERLPPGFKVRRIALPVLLPFDQTWHPFRTCWIISRRVRGTARATMLIPPAMCGMCRPCGPADRTVTFVVAGSATSRATMSTMPKTRPPVAISEFLMPHTDASEGAGAIGRESVRHEKLAYRNGRPGLRHRAHGRPARGASGDDERHCSIGGAAGPAHAAHGGRDEHGCSCRSPNAAADDPACPEGVPRLVERQEDGERDAPDLEAGRQPLDSRPGRRRAPAGAGRRADEVAYRRPDDGEPRDVGLVQEGGHLQVPDEGRRDARDDHGGQDPRSGSHAAARGQGPLAPRKLLVDTATITALGGVPERPKGATSAAESLATFGGLA